MSRDRREDEGQYYPGGRVIPIPPQKGREMAALDDIVTEGSSNGVKSSGIWAFVLARLDALSFSWSKIDDKPTEFPPSEHSHAKESWFTRAIPTSDGIKAAAAELVRTAFEDFDPEEKTFADLVHTLQNIGK